MKRVSMTVCLLGMLTLWAVQAMAAEHTTFVVLPFSIQGSAEYSHLEKAIPQMLTSRLYWKDRVEQAREVPASQKAVTSETEAEKARAAYKADYVVWGTITIAGNKFSLDVRVRNKAGKIWAQAREGATSQIIPSVSSVSDTLNREVFGRKQRAETKSPQGIERVNQMNPDIIINEDRPKDVYLNPQFRYSGSTADDESRVRSQALPFNSIGMEVCDADGDGKNEILILGLNTVYAYRFDNNGRLVPIAEFKLPMTNEALSIRSIKRPSGKTWIIVNQADKLLGASTSILTLNGNEFTEEMRNIKYFLNVVKLPPQYIPTLIGQAPQLPQLFRGSVHEMVVQNGQLTTGRVVGNLPKAANVMNFSVVPGSVGDEGGDKVIVLNSEERLTVYTDKGSRISETEDKFSGAAVGIEIPSHVAGLGRDKVTIDSQYYIPMRMLPVDIERDGRYKVLVNKPISTASTIFDRYRFFPQSEIHCLYWDGIGLNLQWKTRRIKGSTVDYTVADANNDGIVDLVVCLNTHPGALGVKARRTIVTLYPLDTNLMDPNTPGYTGDIYDQ